MKTRHLLPLLLLLFVALDLGYSFWEYYQLPLDGDIPDIVAPSPRSLPVLSDPFGWAALTRQAVYVAPNRFFAHLAMIGWFKSVPLGLQRLGVAPISSVYAASAWFSVLVQVLVLYVLGMYASGGARPGRRMLLTAAVLVPLFQATANHNQMAIIDNAVTYTFFYAFPLALLGLFYWPFYRAARAISAPPLAGWEVALLALLAVVLSFNGPVVQGTVAIVSPGICLYWLGRQWRATDGRWLDVWRRIPWQLFGLLLWLGTLCLYSIYIGQFEKESVGTGLVTLAERYRRIPAGLNETFFRRPALALVLGVVLLNALLLWCRLPTPAPSRQMRQALGWLALLALAYVLLLPLGGYRDYRPLIIRRDSIMPILLGLMALYAASTCYLATHLTGRARVWYLGWVVALGVFYTASDNIWRYPTNACQRQALETLAAAATPTVQLPADCLVLAWQPIASYSESEVPAQLLEYWHITQGKRLYQQTTD